MADSLNFNNVAKKYFNVTFADEKKTTIMVGMPTKAILQELTNLKTEINIENDLETLDVLYHVCAKVMSRNKCAVKITKEFLEEVFDFEDIILFLRDYMTFVTEVVGRKN